MTTLNLIDDLNLMKVTDPAIPLTRAAGKLHKTDIVLSNRESLLYDSRATIPRIS